jgi:hypothetical protein
VGRGAGEEEKGKKIWKEMRQIEKKRQSKKIIKCYDKIRF